MKKQNKHHSFWPLIYWIGATAALLINFLKSDFTSLTPTSHFFLSFVGPLILFALPLFFLIGAVVAPVRAIVQGRNVFTEGEFYAWFIPLIVTAAISFTVMIKVAKSGL